MTTLFGQDDSNAVGEDTWELFETIEASFGVELGDFYSLAGLTICELAEKIHKLANYPSREHCLTLIAFYQLRQALEDLLGIPSRSVRPNTPVIQLLPWSSRNRTWKLLQSGLGLSLPRLVFPGWLLSACVIAPLAFLTCAKELFGLGIAWPWLIGCSVIAILPTIVALAPFARSLPLDVATLGDLAKAVVAKNHAVFATAHGTSFQDVLSSLKLLVACEVGLQEADIKPTTRVPADLNIY